MRCYFANSLVRCTAAICLTLVAARAEAVTAVDNGSVETGDIDTLDGNRPFFPDDYTDGTRTFTNPAGFAGTATPGVDSMSTVTGTGLGLGGDDFNGIPLGVTVTYTLRFDVEAIGAGHVLQDGGNFGLGVSSPGEAVAPPSPGGAGTPYRELSAGEQLLFDNFEVVDFSFHDPLNLLADNPSVANPRWRGLRSNSHAAPDSVTISTDAGMTQNVKVFDDNPNQINNNLTSGTFSPTPGPLSSVYVTTTAGTWPMKSIGWQVDVNYDLAPAAPDRRTYKFASESYNGLSTLDLTDSTTTLTVTPFAEGDSSATLAVNPPADGGPLGIGVDSTLDASSGNTVNQRRIDGAVGEALHISFNQRVALESLAFDNLNLNGTETVVVSYVSGENPFLDLDGYMGEYAVGPNLDSVLFTTDAGGRRPYLVTFGMNGQDPIEIEAGTVLSIAANPAVGGGFLLDMITVNLLSDPGLTGDHNDDGKVDAADYVAWRKLNIDGEDGYTDWRTHFGEPGSGGSSAVPEPNSFALILLAVLSYAPSWRRKA